jgi:hypothetical protein
MGYPRPSRIACHIVDIVLEPRTYPRCVLESRAPQEPPADEEEGEEGRKEKGNELVFLI